MVPPPRATLVEVAVGVAKTVVLAWAVFGCGSGGLGPYPLVGSAAPRASFAWGRDAISVDTRVLTGRVVVVVFFASWCDSCRDTLQRLEGFRTRYPEAVVLVVGLDRLRQDSEELARTLGIGGPMAWDSTRTLTRRWLVSHVPCVLVLDREGIIRFGAWDSEGLDVAVGALLGPG
ncbi:MAG: TlpA disulfide reductase family protein [Myxococcales bacterium]